MRYKSITTCAACNRMMHVEHTEKSMIISIVDGYVVCEDCFHLLKWHLKHRR